MKTIFALEDLTLGYERHPAVHHLTGNFLSGTLTAVVGPNGAGKSTLLKGLVGLIKPLDVKLNYSGLQAQDIAYLPQQSNIDRSFPISVMDTVLLGHWKRIGLFRRVSISMCNEAKEALAAVGMIGFENRLISSLSSGQFQRILFARMLLQNSPVILLDEPFTAIDTKTTNDLLKVISKWHGEKRTIIAVLHDLEQVEENFPETLIIAREAISWGLTKNVLSPENLYKARLMSEAWEENAEICNRNVA